MSVKGYDAQVMVHRVNDYSKDANTVMRRGDMQHDQAAVQIKEESELKQSQVATVDETENPNINPDAEGSNAGYQQQQQQEHSELDELLPGDVPHKLDVRI